MGCRKARSSLLVHICYLTAASLMIFLQVYFSDLPLLLLSHVVCRENISIWGEGFVPSTVAELLLHAGTSGGRQC